MKWSNHAETRDPSKLGVGEVAEGYIPMAVRVLAGEAKLGDTPEERMATLRKAGRIMRAGRMKHINAKISVLPPHWHVLAAIRQGMN